MNNMNEKNTGAFIASLRKERDLTQKQLAEKLNVTDKAVSKWETGKGYPDIDSLMALSDYFNVSVNELLMGERLRSNKKEKAAQKNIAAEIINAKQSRRRMWMVIVAFVILTAAYIVSQFFGSKNVFGRITDYFQQDSVCHITDDYTKLEICGVSYERLCLLVDEDRDFVWEENKLLCDRPKVGDRISTQDKVYSVKNCDNYDYICLTHESIYDQQYLDALYCKSEKSEENEKGSESGKKVYSVNGSDLSDDFTHAVETLSKEDCYNGWTPDGDFYDICWHYEGSPLLRFYGYLGEEDGRYFITFTQGDVNDPEDTTYRLSESVSDELSAIVSTEK